MRKTLMIAALMSTSLLGNAAHAEDKLPKEVLEMECLVGHWKGTGTVAMDGKKLPMTLSFKCERTSAKWGIQCHDVFEIQGLGRYEETDLFGFDPGARKYHWFAITNMGETHDHVAAIPTGNTIDWVYDGLQDGKKLRETIHMAFGADGKSIEFRSETTVDGKSVAVFEAKTRK